LLFISGLAGIGMIWAEELQTIAVSMLAFAAALILATKELILCVSGFVVRHASNSYSLGDHIEVGNIRGRVVDIGLLSTTVMEIGPQHNAHQMTGRALTFPNSLLSNAVIRENYMGDYVMHIINVPVGYAIPPTRARTAAGGSRRTLPASMWKPPGCTWSAWPSVIWWTPRRWSRVSASQAVDEKALPADSAHCHSGQGAATYRAGHHLSVHGRLLSRNGSCRASRKRVK
jgi:hypothetical protein